MQKVTRRISFRPFRVHALVLIAGVFCLALPGSANTDQVWVHTYKLPAGGHFVLDNINGSVQVEGWDRDEVEVRAIKTSQNDERDLDQVKIEVESHPSEVDVHTRYPDGDGADVAVEYHIHVPNHVRLGCIQTVNGSLMVRGVEGGGVLRSVNGNVEVTESSGRFNAKTTNGNLRLELRNLVDAGPMNLETVNGSVVLGLPSNASADLNVRNMNGDLYSDFPVTSTTTLPGARAFRGRLGHGGGGQISVRTVNGGIRLLLEHPGV
ncbi:MAG TPA: DUF4097 family beta strand repeat-containing protein [Candidatus Acidoferrales bacterium]|nr:DUF4097 family beta strand repeat-containing protein [Candidatus Acidoferrales bacterium]